MNAKEPTWFVRIQGHTLGPLSSEQLKAGLREGNVNIADKIIRSGENAWQAVGDHQELADYWQIVRRPTPSFEVPSLNVLWKKSKPPIPVAPPKPQPVIEAKAAEPEVPKQEPISAAKIPELVPEIKAAKAAKKIKAVKVAPAPAPVEAAPIAPAIEFRAEPEQSEVEKEIIRILETKKREEEKAKAAVAAFPLRPEVPEVFRDFDNAREFKKAKIDLVPKTDWKSIFANGNLRVAAGVALLVLVAGIAYWAGQKTRDLKELPLPDPSSPTTQPSTAGDPIQPLRAPTRPQRE